jgi:hypothetical protein
VLKLGAQTLDQSADFRVDVERPEASKFADKVQASVKPSDFSHSLPDSCISCEAGAMKVPAIFP